MISSAVLSLSLPSPQSDGWTHWSQSFTHNWEFLIKLSCSRCQIMSCDRKCHTTNLTSDLTPPSKPNWKADLVVKHRERSFLLNYALRLWRKWEASPFLQSCEVDSTYLCSANREELFSGFWLRGSEHLTEGTSSNRKQDRYCERRERG